MLYSCDLRAAIHLVVLKAVGVFRASQCFYRLPAVVAGPGNGAVPPRVCSPAALRGQCCCSGSYPILSSDTGPSNIVLSAQQPALSSVIRKRERRVQVGEDACHLSIQKASKTTEKG